MQTYSNFLNYTNKIKIYLTENQLITLILGNTVPIRLCAEIVSLDKTLVV